MTVRVGITLVTSTVFSTVRSTTRVSTMRSGVGVAAGTHALSASIRTTRARPMRFMLHLLRHRIDG